MKLPRKWIDGLQPAPYESRPTAELSAAEAREWFSDRGGGEMCSHMERVTSRATAWFAEHGEDGAYDHMNGLAWGLARDVRDGHPGVSSAAKAIERAYVAEVAKRRGGQRKAEAEWRRSLAGAVQKVAAEAEAPGDDDPCEAYKRWNPTSSPDTARFALMSAADLAKPVPAMRWLVKGVWPEKSHGPLAGAKKTLKSWHSLALAVAIASGEPFLGQFEVGMTGPVLIFNGEGGAGPFARRYQRVCEAYGVAPADLPVSLTFDVGPLDGAAFRTALAAHLDALQPVLVVLDPLYVYHPAKVEAQNLYERGRMLGELSTRVGHETALIVVDHYRKQNGGVKLDLDEVGQSGVAQWADSWILQAHRDPPDLVAGEFRVGVEFGSRQWGGKRWDIDWSLPFDHALGEPDGRISWAVEASDGVTGRSGRITHEEIQNLVSAWIRENEPATKDKIIEAVAAENHVGAKAVRVAFAELDRALLIRSERGKVREGSRFVTRDVWVPGNARVELRSQLRSTEEEPT